MLEIKVETVPDFLRAVLPTERHFPAERWIFRGQGDAKWGLVPSIRREKAWRRLGGVALRELKAADGLVVSSEDDLKTQEGTLLTILGQAIDRLGLPGNLKEGDNLLAFAQHIGLPTRLLDWTETPMVATYFAAADAVQLSGDGRLVVYAASSLYVQHSGRLDHVERLRIPAHGNTNLVAQNGVLLKVNVGPVDLLTGLERREIKPGEPLPEMKARALDNHLIAITLPWQRAPALLRALRDQGIHAGTLFPGATGIAELVREVMRT